MTGRPLRELAAQMGWKAACNGIVYVDPEAEELTSTAWQQGDGGAVITPEGINLLIEGVRQKSTEIEKLNTLLAMCKAHIIGDGNREITAENFEEYLRKDHAYGSYAAEMNKAAVPEEGKGP